MSKHSYIGREQEIFKGGKVNFKVASAYLKETGRILRDIEKVSKAIEKFGYDKSKIRKHLLTKYEEAEVNRLIDLYSQYCKVNLNDSSE